MARIKIDLLPKQAEVVKKTNRTITYMVMASRILVVGFIVAAALIYGIYFYFQNANAGVKSQVDAAAANIQQSSQEELKYRLYQQILAESDTIIKSRKDFRGIFSDLNTVLPTGITVRGLTFDEGAIVFDGSANGVGAFGRALDSFGKIESGGTSRFGQVALTQVARGPDGIYNFRMEVGLAKP